MTTKRPAQALISCWIFIRTATDHNLPVPTQAPMYMHRLEGGGHPIPEETTGTSKRIRREATQQIRDDQTQTACSPFPIPLAPPNTHRLVQSLNSRQPMEQGVAPARENRAYQECPSHTYNHSRQPMKLGVTPAREKKAYQVCPSHTYDHSRQPVKLGVTPAREKKAYQVCRRGAALCSEPRLACTTPPYTPATTWA
jgi:hypothetical protein